MTSLANDYHVEEDGSSPPPCTPDSSNPALRSPPRYRDEPSPSPALYSLHSISRYQPGQAASYPTWQPSAAISSSSSSPARVEYPRPAERKRKTPEPAAIPAKRRKVTKTSEHTVRKTKTTTPQCPLSKGAAEKECVGISSNVESTESHNDSASAGPPATDRLSRSSYEEHSHPQSQFDESSLGTGGVEQSGTSQNLSITQETKASDVTPAMSPYPTLQYVPLPRFEWESSSILKVIPVNSRPVRLEAVCRSSDGTKQSIWLDDLIDRCPRKVALYFQKAAIKSYQTEAMVV